MTGPVWAVDETVVASADSDQSCDDFLGGRFRVFQPRKGHRSGIEAVLIAAAAPLNAGETVLDIGAGVGVAGFCALSRVDSTQAILVEADPGLAALARANAKRNGFGLAGQGGRVDVRQLDVAARGAIAKAGLAGTADHALANPPFHDPAASRVSPTKVAAHAAPAEVLPAEVLDAWVRFAASAVKPGGSLTLIHRAEALMPVLDAFGKRFGGALVLPIHPRPGQPATRIIVQGRKGSRAPLAILPGLVLHEREGNAFQPDVEAILRDGAKLELKR